MTKEINGIQHFMVRCIWNLWRIFGTYNLLEYKSSNTALDYNVFLKGVAYAYLYKANETLVDEILLEDVTLSFIRDRKPLKLLKN